MFLRVFQIIVAIINCLYGLMLLLRYEGAAKQIHNWPLSMDQQVLLLIGICVFPAALIGFRFPIAAGILEFTSAFVGRQLLHMTPYPELLQFSQITRGLALAVLIVALLRGVTSVSREAFAPLEEREEEAAHPVA